jgi:hypothetical protein
MKKVDGKTVKGDDKLDPNVLPTNIFVGAEEFVDVLP